MSLTHLNPNETTIASKTAIAPAPTLLPVIPFNHQPEPTIAATPLFGKPVWDAQQQRLTIEIGALSGSPTTVLLTGWEQGLQVSLRINGNLEPRNNPFAPSLFPIEFFDQPLLQDWVQTIPAEVVQQLQRYSLNPLGFLLIINQDFAAYELFLDHPLLFTLLYQQTQQRQQSLTWFLLQCRAKRHHLLAACGLPGNPSVVKFLKKLQVKRFNPQHILLLSHLFKLDYAGLNHLPILSESLLRCVIKHPLLLSSRLLVYWRDEDAKELLQTLDDIQRMRRHCFIAPKLFFEPLRKCRKVADVIRLHDRLVHFINQQKPDTLLKFGAFPPPPMAGNRHIQAIHSYGELLAEGQLQHHCVASYAGEIRLGEYYVYRLLAPERATLGVKIYATHSEQLTLVIDQLKGPYNRPVSAETEQAVLAWLNSQTGKGERHD